MNEFTKGQRVQIASFNSDGGRYGFVTEQYKPDSGMRPYWIVELDPEEGDDPTLTRVFQEDELKHVSPLILLAECADKEQS